MKGRGGWAGDFKYLTFVVFYGSDKWGVTFICSPKQGGEPARGGEDEKKRGGVEKDLERHRKGGSGDDIDLQEDYDDDDEGPLELKHCTDRQCFRFSWAQSE